MTESWVDDVLHFWFVELPPHAWFSGDASTDALVRMRFLALHEELRRGLPPGALMAPEPALAAVIALDQFPRNLYRGQAETYAADSAALAAAERAVALGFDRAFDPTRRHFFYLPFMHAEDRAMQARSVELCTALGDADVLDYARRHRAVVDRFGRFPHRNAVLGRPSTPDELEFLKAGRGF
ncbi:MAG: DUF924 domain-containing protein [Alphaproteobacteria bacterium]|nr:DUF924 domain-containing protein [Alphaproteobacteria bacterium]